MKKLLLIILAWVMITSLPAQTPQLQQGNFVIDANTTVNNIGGFGLLGNGTSFLLSSADETTIWNIGAEAGYFVIPNLAIKLGAGYGDYDGSNIFSYKFGGKYYIIGLIPIQVDIAGQVSDDLYEGDNPYFLGMQGGYAIFIGNMISLEPSLRYNLALNDLFNNVFQVQVGFSLFF